MLMRDMFDRYFANLQSWLDWSQSVTQIWWSSGATAALVRPGRASDAADLAALHATSFAHPWTALTLEQMLTDRAIVAHVAEMRGRPVGFILSRKAADEAEILTIAVAETMRRAGLGQRLLEANLDVLVRERISALFLEVEAGNTAALALYRAFGFDRIGMRKGYYRSSKGAEDALTMRLDLNRRVPRPPTLDG